SVNSVATKHLEAFSIYAGNPAVKIKDRLIEIIV
ncbi:MAG: colanic acid biosynthesis acetyltransferase WcaF, partial [Bacteroidetes bacterium CG_4_10_14_3_um_filter_31_20]